MKSKDSNSKKSVSYQKKDGYDNDKDLKVSFLVIVTIRLCCMFIPSLLDKGKENNNVKSTNENNGIDAKNKKHAEVSIISPGKQIPKFLKGIWRTAQFLLLAI